MKRFYLDNCATTPVAPEVAEAVTAAMANSPGNPSSIHYHGRQSAQQLALARATVADWIGARPAEIVFTSSGTEANNLAIGGIISRAIREKGVARVVTSAVEHASVSTRLAWEQKLHGDKLHIERVGVDAEGQLDAAQLRQAINDDTDLVVLLLVNNETGALQGIDTLKAVKFANPKVPWLLDVVQAQTRLAIDVRLWPFEMLSFSAHKIYAPRGTGALYLRGGTELDPLLVGGAQEKYRRAGTENFLGIAGFAEAVRIAPPVEELELKLHQLERTLLDTLRSQGVGFTVNGAEEPGARRLPGFMNLSFDGVAGREDLQIALDLEGVSLSSTSACHSGITEESHVLKAMGITGPRLSGAVRLLFSRYHTEQDARDCADIIGRVVKRIQDAQTVSPARLA